MKLKIPAILFLFISILACSKKETSDSKIFSNEWELVILDSIQIPTLERLELMAVHSEKDILLFSVSGQNNPLIIASGQGVVLNRLDVPEDSPTGFGGICSSAIFMGDTIVIQGSRGIYFYDLEFQFLSGFKRPYSPKGMIYMGFDHLKSSMTFLGPALVSFAGNPQTEYPPSDKLHYEEYNALDLIPLNNMDFQPILPLDSKSRFMKSGEAFNFIALSFDLNESKLTYAHQLDTILFDVDLMDSNLTQRPVGIPFDEFIMTKGFPYGGQQDYDTPTDLLGNISSIFKVNDLDLILYTSGLKLENFPPQELERSRYGKNIDQLNPQKWIVRTNQIKFSQPKLSSKNYRIVRVDSQNRIWAMQNVNELNEEPEVVTVYQLQLVKK